jgi:hypothetical protein
LCHDPAPLSNEGTRLAFVYIQEEESETPTECLPIVAIRKFFTMSDPLTKKGPGMKTTAIDALKVKICGKRIVSVEPSKWSGEVKLLSKNHDYVSIKLDDGTTLEIGSVYLHDGNKICDSHTNP